MVLSRAGRDRRRAGGDELCQSANGVEACRSAAGAFRIASRAWMSACRSRALPSAAMLMKLLALEGAVPTAMLRSERRRGRLGEAHRIWWPRARSPHGQPIRCGAGCSARAGGRTDRAVHSPRRTFIQYGALSCAPVPQTAISGGPTYVSPFFGLRTWCIPPAGGTRSRFPAQLRRAAERPLYQPCCRHPTPWSRLADALAHQADPRRDGKILLDPRC